MERTRTGRDGRARSFRRPDRARAILQAGKATKRKGKRNGEPMALPDEKCADLVKV